MTETAVIDASLVIDLLLTPELSVTVRNRVGEPDLIAPDHLVVETVHTLRRMVRTKGMSEQGAARLLVDLGNVPIDRKSIDGLLEGIWARRSTMTAYDAAYAALAEEWACPLLTRDAKLAASPQLGCDVILFEKPRQQIP